MSPHCSIELPAGVDCEFLWPSLEGESSEGWDLLLPEDELVRRDGFKSERRRLTFTMGRVAARRLMGRILDVPARDVPLIVAEDGAVDVEGLDGHLSITHTDDAAAAVFSQSPIGVDMEPIEVRIADLYRFVLHESEYEILDRSGMDRNSTTLVCWVVKEAVLKGLRTGLRRSPRDLELSLDFGEGLGRVAVSGGSSWDCRYYRVDQNFVAIAFPSSE